MTLEEWQATRKWTDSIGETVGTTCGEGPGYYYAGGCFIESNPAASPSRPDSRYCLTIENWSSQSDDLQSLERELWERWAKDEIAHIDDRSGLARG